MKGRLGAVEHCLALFQEVLIDLKDDRAVCCFLLYEEVLEMHMWNLNILVWAVQEEPELAIDF